MNDNAELLSWVACGIAGLSFISNILRQPSFIPASQRDDLRAEVKDLRDERARLRLEVERLTREVDGLTTINAALRGDVMYWQKKFQTLDEERDH